jgi:hypothetical protein
VDVYFAPVLPEIPIAGEWDNGDKLKVGAEMFFIAMHEAAEGKLNPFKAAFRLERVSLSILPAEGGGWLLPQVEGDRKPAEAWAPDKGLTAGFEVARRDEKRDERWPFTLEVTTNFSRIPERSTLPAIESKVSRKAKSAEGPEAKKDGDAPRPSSPNRAVPRRRSQRFKIRIGRPGAAE